MRPSTPPDGSHWNICLTLMMIVRKQTSFKLDGKQNEIVHSLFVGLSTDPTVPSSGLRALKRDWISNRLKKEEASIRKSVQYTPEQTFIVCCILTFLCNILYPCQEWITLIREYFSFSTRLVIFTTIAIIRLFWGECTKKVQRNHYRWSVFSRTEGEEGGNRANTQGKQVVCHFSCFHFDKCAPCHERVLLPIRPYQS